MNESIDQLRQRLREDPSSREFVKLGEALRRAGDLDEAARVLAEGLGHHPRDAAAWVLLGRVELERARFQESEAACARALDLDPENVTAARIIGEAAGRSGNWKRALAAWRLALALSPGDPELEERLGEAERKLTPSQAEAAVSPGRQEGAPGGVAVETTAPEPAPPGISALEQPMRAELPREVFALEEADPFAVEPKGDTGTWFTGEDVFGGEWIPGGEMNTPGGPFDEGPEVMEATEGERIPPEPPEVPVPGAEPAEVEAGIVPPSGEEPAFAPGAVSEPAVEAATPPSGVPLPTVTLARLALEQGDPELARQTLDQVVALRGESDETRQLAREIAAFAHRRTRAVTAQRKIERLQGWMRAVRLAAESHGHGV